MKTVTYERVSLDYQESDRQKIEIFEFCQKNGHQIIKSYEEKISGKIKVRPELTAMQNFIENNNEVELVVIHELSRLGRTRQVLETIEFFTSHRVSLYTIKERMYTLKPDKTVDQTTKLTLELMSVINSFELETMKFRMMSGVRTKRIAGKASGGIYHPYGYRNNNGMLEIDDEEEKVVKEIFRMYLKENKGTSLIAQELNRRDDSPTRSQKLKAKGLITGYKIKMKWSETSVHCILRNPIYIGERRHSLGKTIKKKEDGTEYKRKIEYEYFNQPQLAFISKQDFDDTQDLLKSKNQKTGNYRSHEYMLEPRKITCGVCGEKMYYYKRVMKGVPKPMDNRYQCRTKRFRPSCGNQGINIDKVDRLIQAVIFDRYSEILKENLKSSSLPKEIKQYEKDIELVNSQLIKERKNYDKLQRKYVEDEIERDYFLPEKFRYLKLFENYEVRIKLLNSKLITAKNSYNRFIDVKKLESNFSRKNEQLPKDVVNKIITEIIITQNSLATQEFKDVETELKKRIYVESKNDLKTKKEKDEYNKYNKNRPKRKDTSFTNKQDNLFLVTIISGVSKLYYFISQRSNAVFDFQDCSIKFPFDDSPEGSPFQLGFKGHYIYIPIEASVEFIEYVDDIVE